MVIELIGGVGAGKSRVLRILREEYGAAVIETDQTARELERKGQAGYQRLTEAFGEGILGADGELDRKKLAEMIFSDETVLERVNEMIHPLVWEEVYRRAEAFRNNGSQDLNLLPLLVVETALPEEREWSGNRKSADRLESREDQERMESWELSGRRESSADRKMPEGRKRPDVRKKSGDIYDEVWYVYTLEETRIRRLMESRGYSREKCLAVMGQQPTEEEYRALADRILYNNGDEEQLRRQIAEILASSKEQT